MKKALITGVTGQDGAYLSELLLKKGYKVFGTFRRVSTPNFWRLQTLDIFRGSIDLKFFEGFMSNNSYLASDDNNKYVVKIGGNREHYGVVNSHEVEASKAGYRAGISPKVVYC